MALNKKCIALKDDFKILRWAFEFFNDLWGHTLFNGKICVLNSHNYAITERRNFFGGYKWTYVLNKYCKWDVLVKISCHYILSTCLLCNNKQFYQQALIQKNVGCPKINLAFFTCNFRGKLNNCQYVAILFPFLRCLLSRRKKNLWYIN